MTDRTHSKITQVIFPLLYGTLLVLLFSSSYQVMVKQWDSSDYNYCYIVPLVAGYLLWERRQFLQLPSVASWAGIGPLVLGILLYLLGELGGEFYSLYLSSWFMLVGLLWLHLGWRKLRAIAFPVCMLVAMFPFPSAINNPLTLHLKMISSTLGVKILQMVGVAVFLEGNIIDLGFTRLEVVEACSGLRYFFPLILVGLLLAAQYRARFWQRALLVLSAVPLSILINSLRIVSIVWLYPLLGASVLDGPWHDFIGWLIFMFSIAFLLGERWVLLKVVPMGAARPSRYDMKYGQVVHLRPRAAWPLAVVAVLLLAATVTATRAVNFREQVPLARPMVEFPMTLGPWQGSRSSLEQIYLDVLKLSDYLLADYSNGQGQVVSLYVAYNQSQRKGESSHSPASCLPGSGWVFNESGKASLPVGTGGAQAEVKRAFMEKTGVRMLVYYWFPQRGRVLTNIYQLKVYTFWDALTRQRTDGALVRLITTVPAGEQPAVAEARLQEFARLLGPELNGFLPGK